MTSSTVTRGARSANKSMQLARYSVSAGERVIYGQRILGVVRFLPRSRVVVAALTGA